MLLILCYREDGNIHVCGYCLEVNAVKGSYSCSSCSVSFKTFCDGEEMYENVPSVTQKKHLKLGEIIGVNPNSYETVKEVLLNLFEQAEVPQKKKWVHVGFGGVPYQIAADLIENMKQCTICDALVDLKVETEDEHCKECHPEEENIVLKKAFGRILLTCFRVVWGTKISLVFSL